MYYVYAGKFNYYMIHSVILIIYSYLKVESIIILLLNNTKFLFSDKKNHIN